MGSPFQRSFSGKSPLNKHGKIQKKIEKARRKDGDNPDFYETYSHLYDAKAKAEAAHSNKTQDKSQDRRIVEEERDNSRTDASISRKASPLNDGYIKQEEKMIKRNQKKGNQYQSASAGSRTQRMQNAIGSAQAANAITQSKKTINLLKSW